MALTPSIIFISLTGLILILIALVAALEKFISRKQEATLKSPEYLYSEELRNLKQSNLDPQELLNRIDSLAKKALSPAQAQTQQSVGHLDYSQLAETYKDKPHIVQFCAAMTQSLYTGERITPQQTRNLLHSLEDMLKGEGKIIMIEPKKEILEEKKSFFLDTIVESLARKVQSKIDQTKQEEKQAEDTQVKIEQTDEKIIEQPQHFRKVRIAVKTKPSKHDRKEYNYIESIDVLDRIERKLSSRKTAN